MIMNAYKHFDLDNIPIYIYRPVNYETNAPIFIFFHGGAMVAENRLSCDSTCKQLCE